MDPLEGFIFPMLHNSPNESYLEIWHRTFTNNEVKAKHHAHFRDPHDCTFYERLFSRMSRVKTDFCNRQSRSRLDTYLRVGEEGPSIKDFEADHVIDRR